MLVRAQFWAMYRGVADVQIVTVPTMTADDIARLLYDKAVASFTNRFTFPKSDQKAMRIIGVTNGSTTAHNKDRI